MGDINIKSIETENNNSIYGKIYIGDHICSGESKQWKPGHLKGLPFLCSLFSFHSW